MTVTADALHDDIRKRVAERIDARAFRIEKEDEILPCDDCRSGFEKEVDGRMVVQDRELVSPDVSGDGTEAAFSSFDALERAERRRRALYSSRSRRSSIKFPLFFLLGIVVMLAAYIVLFDDSSPTPEQAEQMEAAQDIPEPTRRSTGPVNAFNYAMENYEHLLNGTLEVEYEVENLDEARETIAQEGIAAFDYTGSTMPLAGLIVSSHDGLNLPALVYRDGDDLLYVLTIRSTDLKSESEFYVTDDVWERLQSGETIWVDASHNGNLAMFLRGDEVIVAVGNISSSQMTSRLGIS